MTEPRNGNPVTWRELELALRPLQSGYEKLDGKVDQIMDILAENRGEQKVRSTFMESGRFWVGIAAMLLTGSFGAAIFTLITRSHH